MDSSIDRFLILFAEERMTAPWLEEKTGIEATRWRNIKQRKVMRTSELDAVLSLFPEYALWITTGKEIPEAGQISPMTKKAQRTLKPTPKVG